MRSLITQPTSLNDLRGQELIDRMQVHPDTYFTAHASSSSDGLAVQGYLAHKKTTCPL